eukprot:178209_1
MRRSVPDVWEVCSKVSKNVLKPKKDKNKNFMYDDNGEKVIEQIRIVEGKCGNCNKCMCRNACRGSLGPASLDTEVYCAVNMNFIGKDRIFEFYGLSKDVLQKRKYEKKQIKKDQKKAVDSDGNYSDDYASSYNSKTDSDSYGSDYSEESDDSSEYSEES